MTLFTAEIIHALFCTLYFLKGVNILTTSGLRPLLDALFTLHGDGKTPLPLPLNETSVVRLPT